MDGFTKREQQIFDLLLEGGKIKGIAEKLGVTDNTVKYFVKRIYKKLGVKSKPELIIKYLKNTVVK